MSQTSPSPKAKIQHVVIIGAGIVGVSAGIWLLRAGVKVTVIDPNGPAGGTSYGNAGVLAASSIIPVTAPGLMATAPKYLMDPKSPLFMRWSYLPKLLPFLTKYLPYAREDRTRKIADGLAAVLHDTADQHVAVSKGTGAENYVDVGDYLFGYDSEAAFHADKFSWDIRTDHGFEFEPMDETAIAAFDPFMAGRFPFAVRCPNHGRITDPGAYVKALAAHLESEGATFVSEAVSDVVVENGTAKGVTTDSGTIDADAVVLATGIWSKPLAEKLGVSVPMEAERGYHMEFIDPPVMPKAPVMVASKKYVLTPMGQGQTSRLRCAGIVEFGGLSPDKSSAPLDLLRENTLALVPELGDCETTDWMGFRPSTSDSLPVIGATPSASNVFTGYGHQHVGLTAGPKTGRWIAGLITGDVPNADLAAFSPTRFNRRAA
ncbi:FAD-binding oxidoreductase [Ahrensia sp. R2A130]|uniref:NAD(P)/FAD-dependent oxidoreductase n=1 Tax=Ahrensia sp. R2A130 TaxID=744979 RepID=UPI0001E0D12D|nr:FAD-dependent oxidoreductase [Ahrensia sp. R2A130]EFL87903.1 oxidoreductase, FAD-binding [Ahrensia sp. R2A130]